MEKARKHVIMVCLGCLLSYILLIAVLECTCIYYKDYYQDDKTEHRHLDKNDFSEFMSNSYFVGKLQKNYTSYENRTTYALYLETGVID